MGRKGHGSDSSVASENDDAENDAMPSGDEKSVHNDEESSSQTCEDSDTADESKQRFGKGYQFRNARYDESKEEVTYSAGIVIKIGPGPGERIVLYDGDENDI